MYENSLSWDTLEHHHEPKSADWFWAVGAVGISIAVLCIIFGNILLAVFVLLAALTAGIHMAREPHMVHINLTTRGIQIEDTLYTYESLQSFWIEDHIHPATIIVQSKKHFMPFIVIPISHISPDEVREYLLFHLKEVEHHESLGHKVLEYFGF
ncbi:hypothetical protein KW782_04605 [Candidatus Parcubacteria bacterium]|nr:hypothetical protein [Candidatus Parcubacteria bacterium]